MGKKDDLIAKATELGIELDSTETIADLEAKIAAHEATADGEEKPDDQPQAADAGAPSEPDDADKAEGGTADDVAVPVGSSAWALAALSSGERVMREIWTDNHHLDPAHIRAGIRLTFEDVFANDWKVV